MVNHISYRTRIATLGIVLALGACGAINAQAYSPDLSKRTPGFDVSHFQGDDIDWSAVKAGGSVFVFAKATQGVSTPDDDFTDHVKGANSVGLPVGAYHYFQTGDDGVAQADYYLSTIAGQSLQLPPTLDLEGALTEADFDQAAAWLDHVKTATGCQPLLYIDMSNYTQFAAKLATDQPVWLAEYASTLPSDGPPVLWFWQYSETGTVDGISGEVDADWFFGAVDDLAQLRCAKLDAAE